MLPFKQKSIGKNKVIRTFSSDTANEEFKWHRDAEERIITPLVETDWKIQIDNHLPMAINGSISIPAGVYHRIIKGTGNLHLEIEMLEKKEIDGKNL